MDIAITGSTGLIGEALRTRLLGDGHRVVRVVRHEPTGPDEIRWDPATGHLEAADLDGLDAVVHLAGEGIAEKRWSDAQKAEILQSRVRGTTTLAEAMAALGADGPQVLVSTSAIGYYGDRGDTVLTETSGPGDDFLADVCQQWEAAADPARRAGIRVAHPRLGIVQSTKGGALGTQLPLFKFGLGGPIGPGTQWWSWVHIDDAVGALAHLLDNDVSGPANVTAPNPLTNAEHAKALGRALHRPALLRPPRFALDLRLGRELAQALLLTSARVLPAALESTGFVFSHPDLDEALHDLVGH